MSATKQALSEVVESVMNARGIPLSDMNEYLEVQASIMASTGYTCKTCNGPAPMGVGYAHGGSVVAAVASLSIVACPCGASFSYAEHVARLRYLDPATYAAIAAGDFKADPHVVAAVLHRESGTH